MVGEDPPAFADARDHVVAEVVRFARTLRANGAAVPGNAALEATRAIVTVGLGDRAAVRAATQATLVSEAGDRETFEEHFPAFWYRLRSGLEAAATADDFGGEESSGSGGLTISDAVSEEREDDDGDEEDRDPDAADGDDADGGEVRSRHVADAGAEADAEDDPGALERETRTGTYSVAGEGSVVGEDDEAGHATVDPAAVDRLVRALATLPGRRWTTAKDGPAIDARQTRRRSLGTGGVPMRLARRQREDRALRACVLVDVSRSVLDAVDRRVVLSFLAELVDAGRSVRVFFFDTDIREVTGAFRDARGDPLAALERAEVAWGGGTRIGESLSTLRRRWPGAVDRRTVTLVLSDGLDVGEVDVLDREMVWLSRRSAATLWFNPLAVSAAYRPTCRGMATALPYLDGLFAFGGSADVTEAAAQIERRGVGGPLGYEHDFRERERDRDDRSDAAGGASA